MNGYSNLASSPPPLAAVTKGARARRSLELTNTKETNAWEGLAIGAVTLARTFSTGSQRLCSRSGDRARGTMRRAFSMRRHPAAPGKGDGYYWRIHDMDGDIDHGGDQNAVPEERGDEEEEGKKKKEEARQREEGEAKEGAKREQGTATPAKKKRGSGNILKACKKLFRL
ncbi:uncharacterized protein LOC123413036 [Hordeum vulgare subsp. vulgare]|uniref:Predicted protein n=1 Tax=Hordeum vulgare subsp. vulgare TaxID=112509 RepID=F2EJ10_HORVV|nr:uncharacterized protein LOC123413036 [Hordeum vulgare subsp. vulgare]BAK07332.1 predicted protein [Hordeum vulgare subsp. vulgare]